MIRFALVFLLVAVPSVSLAQGPPLPNDSVAKSASSTPIGELKFSRTLRKGMAGDDVRALQEHLLLIPDVYPNGSTTGYFGKLTEEAVKRFQEREGIAHSGTADTTGYGLVGRQTLAKINGAISHVNAPKSPGSKSTTHAQSTTTATTSPR